MIKWLFKLIWHKRFEANPDWRLFKVTGWRSCLVDDKNANRLNLTFLFKGEA